MIKAQVENIPWLAELEELQERFEKISPLNYSEIKEELDGYVVKLDPDPSSKGLDSLNKKIADVDSFISRVVTILTNAIANENKFESFFSDVVVFYNKHLRIQLRQKEVADLSNQKLQQAAAEERIEDIGRLKYAVEKTLNDAKTHTKICKEKLDNLDKTNKNISRQITVIQTQLEVGEIQRKVSGRFKDSF